MKCKICGKESGKRKTCSPECLRAARNPKHSEEWKKRVSEKLKGRGQFSEESLKKALDTLQMKWKTDLDLTGYDYNEAKFLVRIFSPISDRLGESEPAFKLKDYKGVYYGKLLNRNYYPFRCKRCGRIFQDHFGAGNVPACPDCFKPESVRVKSKGEAEIKKILSDLGIEYETEKSFEGLKYKKKLRFDFYIEPNIVIEYQGAQHFEPIYGEETLKEQKVKDELKKKWCEENGFVLIEIFPDTNISEEINKCLTTISTREDCGKSDNTLSKC